MRKVLSILIAVMVLSLSLCLCVSAAGSDSPVDTFTLTKNDILNSTHKVAYDTYSSSNGLLGLTANVNWYTANSDMFGDSFKNCYFNMINGSVHSYFTASSIGFSSLTSIDSSTYDVTFKQDIRLFRSESGVSKVGVVSVYPVYQRLSDSSTVSDSDHTYTFNIGSSGSGNVNGSTYYCDYYSLSFSVPGAWIPSDCRLYGFVYVYPFSNVTSSTANMATDFRSCFGEISVSTYYRSGTVGSVILDAANDVTSALDEQTKVILEQAGFITSTIVDNQNSNTDKIIDNQNSNTDKIVDNQNDNTDRVIANQNSNTDKIVDSQNENTDRVIANQNENADRIIDNQNENTDKVLNEDYGYETPDTPNVDDGLQAGNSLLSSLSDRMVNFDSTADDALDTLSASVDDTSGVVTAVFNALPAAVTGLVTGMIIVIVARKLVGR